LIKQFLPPDHGQVAREILLDTIADGRRKFIKNLLVDFLVCRMKPNWFSAWSRNGAFLNQ
jgi:hypothetical protein